MEGPTFHIIFYKNIFFTDHNKTYGGGGGRRWRGILEMKMYAKGRVQT